jgi:hypothetical protein
MSNNSLQNFSNNTNQNYIPINKNVAKVYLFDIDGNELILTKYDVYFTKDIFGNRQYYKSDDDTPLFQSIELISNYKKLKFSNIS